ncbi:MAG: 50S ribosomal protein L4 [Candidatus Gracilibacteria bacterium]|jgi:large subunit ribosomal protein L4
MKIDLYTQSGEKKGSLELPKEIFEVPFNKDLVHQALVMQLANQRYPIAHTKTKGEVRGGGRKPYKQKGTGNARQGSIRAPQMRGGGVIFGPRNTRNFHKSMPKKQRTKALFCALSEKARDNQIIGLEPYTEKTPKTKTISTLLKKLPIKRKVLIVSGEKNTVLAKSCENIANAKTILASYLNIQDLQRYQTVILFKDAVDKIKATFLTKE